MKVKDEKGVALILGVIIVFLVTSIGGGFLVVSYSQSKVAFSSAEREKALIVADAALEKARRALYWYKSQGSWNWNGTNGILDYNLKNGTTNTETIKQDFIRRYNSGEYLYQPPYQVTLDQINFAYNNYFDGAGYYVYVTDDNDDGNPTNDTNNTIIITVTATLPDGTQRQIQAVANYQPGVYTPQAAIVSGASLKINGSPTIAGSNGNVHANLDIIMSGNPTISGVASASGVITISGSPTLGGKVEGAPLVTIPDINVWQLTQYVDYYLWNDQKIYDKNWNLVFDGTGGGTWNGLKASGTEWGISGNTAPPPGTYFANGSFKISGNPGSDTDPAKLTVFATGSIVMTGNPRVQPYLTNTLFVAMGDIKIAGNPQGNLYQGLIAAREQVQLSGNAKIKGSILSQDASDVDNTVSSQSDITVTVNGNPNLTYDGDPMATIIPAGGCVAVKGYKVTK